MYQFRNNYLISFYQDNKNKRWFYIFLFLLLLRILLSIIPPQFSTDFLRNLFYGDAFWKFGFQVYDLTPKNIDPNYNILDPTTQIPAYAYSAYDYPVIQIIFWAITSLLPFSTITGKWVLLIFDIANFLLIRDFLKEKGSEFERNAVSLVYFAFMIIISTIEGQAEGITLFLMLLALKYLNKKPLYSYALIAVGVQWKYIPVILLPYALYQHRKDLTLALKGMTIFILLNLVLSFPILISDYVSHYILYGGELPNNQIPSNPMAWMYNGIHDQFFLSSLILWIILLYIFYQILLGPLLNYFKNQAEKQSSFFKDYTESVLEQFEKYMLLLPILLFLKYYRFAFSWYWLWLVPGMLTVDEIHRKRLWISLLVLFPIMIIDTISLTENWDFILNFFGL